ncbi:MULTISPECIES: hypothetical protein [Sinorhizobium]|nr:MULTISPECIES: hypothetical protein [Sinorhizobium]WOS66967.1 hypothetical protein SFGR64A_31710 [Sinorhizobium fredii GR64]
MAARRVPLQVWRLDSTSSPMLRFYNGPIDLLARLENGLTGRY